MTATAKQSDVFSTQTIAKPERISRETGEMFGARALQLGRLSPGDARPWKVDRTTLEQLESLVNKSTSGAKMRPGHPMSGSPPLTVAKGSLARIVKEGEEQYVAIDVKFTKASKTYQQGEWRDLIFDQAEETPEDFGLSIDPVLDLKAMKTKDADGLIPIRLLSLNGIDFVDDAAATRGGLFSTEGNGADMSTENTTAAELATLKTEHEAIKKERDDLKLKLSTVKPETPPDQKDVAKAELSRRSEISALCALAKVPDVERDLFLNAGFSRAEAQDFLKSSGKLSTTNPPISEGGTDPNAKQKPEETFGTEYDQNKDIFQRQGLSRESYINSRMVDAGHQSLAPKPVTK